jgi:hypothetical protein
MARLSRTLELEVRRRAAGRYQLTVSSGRATASAAVLAINLVPWLRRGVCAKTVDLLGED